MIILNQEKSLVLNFNNISRVYIEENELIKKFLVKAISEDDSIVLGIYSDIKLAQKNLEGIINKYLEYATIGRENNTRFATELPRIYIMTEDKEKEVQK